MMVNFLVSSGSVWALDCGKAITTLELSECAREDAENAELALKSNLEAVRQKLEGNALEAFNKAQNLWNEYVELDCKVVYESSYGGSIANSAFSFCQKSHVQARNKVINQRFLVLEKG